MCKFFKDLMHGEPLKSFMFKQLCGVALGALIATAWSWGDKVFQLYTKAPTCKIKLLPKDSIGFTYDWTMKIKNTNMGNILIYPKDDILILLNSLKKPERVVGAEEINLSIDKKYSKGLVLFYADGSEEMELNFKTYSSRLIFVSNTKDATCKDLLVDL